jgi:hypothetical protein
MTRMTLEEAEAHQRRVKGLSVDQMFSVEHRQKHRPRPNTALISQAAAKKSKFKNIRCEANDGTRFASRLERDYYEQLLLRWKAGEVLWFVRQPSFDLEGGVIYRADFLVVRDRQDYGCDVDVIDCKGFITEACANKLRQMKARYGIDVRLVTKV